MPSTSTLTRMPPALIVLTLALIALRIEETVPVKKPQALQFSTLMRSWLGILFWSVLIALSAWTLVQRYGKY